MRLIAAAETGGSGSAESVLEYTESVVTALIQGALKGGDRSRAGQGAARGRAAS